MQQIEKLSKFSFFPETGAQCNFEGAEQVQRSNGELKMFNGFYLLSPGI